MRRIIALVFGMNAAIAFAQQQVKLTVNFDFDRYVLTPSAVARLDSFMTVIPARAEGFHWSVYGHCDSIGSLAYNDVLSQKRVSAVKAYLIGKGLDSLLIDQQKGYGKRKPLTDNASAQHRWLNRRVELVANLPEVKPVPPPVKQEIPVIEQSISKTIADTATRTGTRIRLKNLNFVGGMHTLLPQSYAVLDELLQVMKKNPQLVIAIEGHVCCIPDEGDGVDIALGTRNLSEMRAKAVYDYLLANGIAANRISYRGFGHKYPLTPFPEMSESDKVLNRRVEIRIVNK